MNNIIWLARYYEPNMNLNLLKSITNKIIDATFKGNKKEI